MSGYEFALLLGVFISFAGAALTVWLAWRRWRDLKAGRYAPRLENLLELAGPALVFGGVALVQFANLALHARERPEPHHIWLSIVATGSTILVFGMLLGRLLTRWQLQQLHAVVDTETGAIRPLA